MTSWSAFAISILLSYWLWHQACILWSFSNLNWNQCRTKEWNPQFEMKSATCRCRLSLHSRLPTEELTALRLALPICRRRTRWHRPSTVPRGGTAGWRTRPGWFRRGGRGSRGRRSRRSSPGRRGSSRHAGTAGTSTRLFPAHSFFLHKQRKQANPWLSR